MVRYVAPIAVLALLGAATPPARAASATVALSGGVLAITGDDGDNKIIESSYDDPFETESDPERPTFMADGGGTLTAATGCNQLSATTVECPGLSGAQRVTISLGTGNDSVAWPTAKLPMTVDAGPGDDEIVAGQEDDVIDGGAGDDVLVGGVGQDRLTGGSGQDSLQGDTDGGSSTSTVKPARDTVLAKDGERDKIECTDGLDRITADRSDQIGSGCSGRGSSGSTNSSGALKLSAERAKPPSLRRFTRGAPIKVRVRASQRCRMSARLTVTRSERRRLGYRGPLEIASSNRFLQPGRRVTISLRARKSLRRAARSRKSATIGIRVACTAAGAPAVVRLKVRLGR